MTKTQKTTNKRLPTSITGLGLPAVSKPRDQQKVDQYTMFLNERELFADTLNFFVPNKEVGLHIARAIQTLDKDCEEFTFLEQSSIVVVDVRFGLSELYVSIPVQITVSPNDFPENFRNCVYTPLTDGPTVLAEHTTLGNPALLQQVRLSLEECAWNLVREKDMER